MIGGRIFHVVEIDSTRFPNIKTPGTSTLLYAVMVTMLNFSTRAKIRYGFDITNVFKVKTKSPLMLKYAEFKKESNGR